MLDYLIKNINDWNVSNVKTMNEMFLKPIVLTNHYIYGI